jgi:LPXTG-site transpeptidase (sortase) family protein
MAKSKNNKSPLGEDRTRSIPVKSHEEAHYTLHIMPAETPREVIKKKQPALTHQNNAKRLNHGAGHLANQKLQTKIWLTLEWLATSALVFMMLFFVMNYASYFELFKLKLDQLRGTYNLSPYIERMLQTKSPQTVTQQLLPVATTPEASRQQIPPLDLQVSPPDDRIIIPRINKNVPIINVSTENLLKRDWDALEKDIQEALRSGVVHYPGTAQPGEHGNVVITGHSSYFVWDPGRFKDVFALLHEVVVGDTILIYRNQEKYVYQVYKKEIVTPDQVNVLTQQGEDRLTLITCTPVGTNLKRLIVLAKPV